MSQMLDRLGIVCTPSTTNIWGMSFHWLEYESYVGCQFCVAKHPKLRWRDLHYYIQFALRYRYLSKNARDLTAKQQLEDLSMSSFNLLQTRTILIVTHT